MIAARGLDRLPRRVDGGSERRDPRSCGACLFGQFGPRRLRLGVERHEPRAPLREGAAVKDPKAATTEETTATEEEDGAGARAKAARPQPRPPR
ncbi:hypothetical protein, partial [Microbacterium ureisolvens]|uniref:hypothetical protein n=1 Tax=Microbacterium ureisolvens TaxID=2781186 RepID=UPI001F557A3A